MKKAAEQIQVLYEIAMSIGKSLDLKDMLKNALTTYLRKLNCTVGIIYRVHKLPDDNYRNEQIFSLPYTFDVTKKIPELLEIFPEFFSKEKYEKGIFSSPEIYKADTDFLLHIMRLGEFGYIVLIKSKRPVEKDLLKQLREINEKLGQACISCLNNESLKESEKKYRDLSELLPGMVCETDINGYVTFVNQYAVEKLGYDISELDKGFHILKIFSKEDQERAKKNFARSLIDKDMPSREYDVVKENGEKFPALLYTNQLISGGKVKGVRGVMIDISDRKENENKIKLYAERLELALMASGAGLWNYDILTNKLTLNTSWYESRGIKPDVNSWESHIHPDDRSATQKAIQDHAEGKIPFYQVEYRTETETGKFIWVMDTGKITEYDSSGHPLFMVGTSIDITSKKENEIKLQENYAQQELLSDIALNLNSLENFYTRINFTLQKIGIHTNVSRVYIFEDEKDGLTTSNTYEWCNDNITPQINELQNISYKELIPSWKKILNEDERIYSEDIKDLPEDIVAILEPQEIKSILVYPLRVKGKFFGFIGFDECTKTKHWIKSELELLRTISGIISNAFERKISEKSLRESELANRAIIAALPDMLFHFDKEGKLLNFNFLEGHITIFNEIKIGKGIQNIFPRNLAIQIKSAILKCIRQEQYNFEFELHLENNHAFFEARTSKINNDHVILLMRDITKSKLYETKLTEEKNRAEQANQAKSEFLANMSHEIRTPMNAILGFSEALYNKTVVPEHKDTLKSIVNSGNLLLSLLNDILDLSKIEAGKLEISLQPVDLATLIKEIVVLFNEKAEKKGLSLQLNINENLPNTLIIDEIRIKQVIFNIIGNALKFTNKGYVKIDVVFTYVENDQGTLCISIKDSGIGIPESQYERIFEAFIQQSGQSNREYEGVGLGLSISKRLIEKMNGTIDVSSTVGKGSVFRITIPNTQVIKSSPNIEPKVEPKEIVFDNAKILIVDDVISNIKMMQYLLKSWGLEFISAENGRIALDILENTIPDAILLDIRMPEIDGFEVAKLVKSNPITRNIPLIACTASVSNKGNLLQSKEFDAVIFKPIKPKELKEIFKEKLKHKIITKKQDSINNNELSLENLKKEIREKLPEILQILNNDFLPIWNKISGSLILFQIEDFANELKMAMKPYKFGFLIAYSNKILHDVNQIKLESLKDNINKFPSIIEEIKKQIET